MYDAKITTIAEQSITSLFRFVDGEWHQMRCCTIPLQLREIFAAIAAGAVKSKTENVFTTITQSFLLQS